MSDYEPTIGDIWPNEESMPPEVKEAFSGLYALNEASLARIHANPLPPTKRWWDVRRNADGSIEYVQLNKLGPEQVNLWAFKPIFGPGTGDLHVTRSEWISLDPPNLLKVEEWWVHDWRSQSDEELAHNLFDLIGLRDARGVVARLAGAL